MAATRSNATLLNAVTTSQTSSAQSITGHYGGTIAASIAVVGTPTTAASITPQWTPDGTNYYAIGGPYGTNLAAGTYQFAIDIPIGAVGIQVVFAAQAGGTSSTCTVQASWVTGL